MADSPISSTGDSSVETAVKTFLAAHQPILFDETRDAEPEKDDGHVSTGVKVAHKAKNIARRLPVNMALGVVTGVPGILFGVTSAVGGAAVSKVKAKTHEKRVSKKPGQITVAPVRAEALANPRAEHTGAGSMVMKKTKLSPYIKATLLMPGVDPSKDAFHGKTKPHLSGGTDFTFASSNHVTLGFEDVDLLDQAGLLLEVKDKPDFALAKTLTHRETHIGRAVVHLAQLQTVAATPEGESAVVSAFINVPLYRDAEWADSAATPSGGMVRFKVTLEA